MPIPAKEKPTVQLSAKEKIFQELSRWIMNGTLAPNEKLNEIEIASYFSVSRTPVREALQLLAEQHLVEIIPGRGSFVTPVNQENAIPIYQALAAINGYISLLACDNRTESDLIKLKNLNDKLREAIEKGEKHTLSELDYDFHSYIADIAQNTYLKQYLLQLQIHAYRYENLFFTQGVNRLESVKIHDCLIEAIASQNKEKAWEAATDNWTQTIKTFNQTL